MMKGASDHLGIPFLVQFISFVRALKGTWKEIKMHFYELLHNNVLLGQHGNKAVVEA